MASQYLCFDLIKICIMNRFSHYQHPPTHTHQSHRPNNLPKTTHSHTPINTHSDPNPPNRNTHP